MALVPPGFRVITGYRRAWLGKDLTAGIVLTTLLVPQGMAYAELAGLPPITGLYTSIMCLLGYALFGPSRLLVLGPDSALGPMIAATTLPLLAADGDPARAIALSSLLALMVGFRSVLIPVKALALNLLSVAAAFGAVVLVFQDGHGGAVLGIDSPLGGVFPAIPILVFCIVFGLSMDYEVFLVSRVAEARRTLGESAAIVEGLARTGGVITSAAAIMIVVFAAFTMNDFIFIKILGFALAVAVLLDATIVRMAIGPALLQLAGRWNWWPGKQSALPRTSWQGAPSTIETRT